MAKFNAGKASVLALSATLVVASFLLGKSLTSVYATAGTVEEGGQCDVIADSDDQSHNCASGLICVEQGQGNGNGKCQLTSTGTPVPTATPFCDEEEEECSTPEPTATPIETATPEATETPVTPNCGGDTHLDLSGTKCLRFEYGGPQAPTGGTGGQVLGASTMAGTGAFDENLYMSIMALGATLSGFGLTNFRKAKKV